MTEPPATARCHDSKVLALRPETFTVVLALALLGCGGHTRGNAPGGAPTTPDPEPTEPEVMDAVDGTLIKVSLSDQSACTLSRDGRVACFELAQGFESASSPVAGKFCDIAGSASVGAALRDDGSVATWGDARRRAFRTGRSSTLPSTVRAPAASRPMARSLAAARPRPTRI